MMENENGFYAWIKTQPKRPLQTTAPKVVDGLACISDSTQNGNGQHLWPDQKIIKLSDGCASIRQSSSSSGNPSIA